MTSQVGDNSKNAASTDNTYAIPQEALDALDHIDDDPVSSTVQMSISEDDDGLLHIGDARFTGALSLIDQDNGDCFQFTNDLLDEVVIGRYDRRTDYRPTLCLDCLNGKEQGVSRRHATITLYGDLMTITDHHSRNGTYLNGQRLIPEQARIFRDGDCIQIAKIRLNVQFDVS